MRNTAGLLAPEIQSGLLERAVETPQARADGERRDGRDVGELPAHHERQPRPQDIPIEPENIVGQLRDAAREREDRDAEDHAGNDQRGQHENGQRLLAEELARAR